MPNDPENEPMPAKTTQAIPTKEEFGDRFRAARVNLGITQDAAADMIGIHRTTYASFENGRCYPSVPTVYKLMNMFQISPARLFRPGEPGDAGGE